MNWNVKRFSMLNISQVILMRTDSNLCRKELTVHWSAPNSLIRSYLQPCTNSMWGDESEAVAPIIWLYQIVDAQKEEVFFPEFLITLRSYVVSGLESRYQLHVSAPQKSLAKCLFIPWRCLSLIQGFFLQHFFKAASSRSLEKCCLRSLLKSSLIRSMKSLVWLHILA